MPLLGLFPPQEGRQEGALGLGGVFDDAVGFGGNEASDDVVSLSVVRHRGNHLLGCLPGLELRFKD
jgi:hypothetical protein